jgi:SAM-dependent methyltransferase
MLNSTFDADPQRYDALRACWLNERRFVFIKEWLAAQPEGDVLEIGSGTGALLRRLSVEFPDRRFVGIDPLPNYVVYSRSQTCNENVEYVCGKAEDAASLLAGRRFAIFLSNDVLHHCEDLGAVASSTASLRADGARWLAIEPNWMNPYSFLRQSLRPGERVFWPASFGRAARNSGWNTRNRGHLFLIPPMVKTPHRILVRAESLLENVFVLAGGLWLELG